MNQVTQARSDRLIGWWGMQILRFPWLTIVLAFLVAGVSLAYTFENLGVNTDTSKMLSPDLPFQKNRARLEAAFPQDSDMLLFVVKGASPEEASRGAVTLAERLSVPGSGFRNVRIPDEHPFFTQEALLYLELEELENLATDLARAQPFIGKLAEDYSLDALFSILGYAVTEPDDSLPSGIDPLLNKIDRALTAVMAGEHYRLSWQNLMLGNSPTLKKGLRFVLAKPEVDFTELLPAEESLGNAQKILREIESAQPGVDIRITGEMALQHQELESVSRGALFAGIASLILVCLSMLFGLKSARMLAATLITLLVGLSCTAGFAAMAVGHLNLISVAFAVLYIGLGVDYAIHLCLRHREFRLQNTPNRESLEESVRTVGLSLFLCALTTSIGFFAFVPTEYVGVSELGVISGAGMFIGLLASLTVLPALLQVMPLNNPKPSKMREALPAWLFEIPFRFSVPIRIAAVALAVGSVLLLSKVQFDSNPVNLRDPNTESVQAYKEILRSTDDSPFFLSLLTDDEKSAAEAADRLATLPTVGKAITVLDLIPENQEEKLYIIEDLNLILGGQLDNLVHQSPHGEPRQALEAFLADIEKALADREVLAANENLIALRDRIREFLAAADAAPDPSAMPKALEASILDLLPDAMDRLRKSLQAVEVGFDDLPRALTEHWISNNGIYRVMIFPEHDLNVTSNLRNFVAEVVNEEPDVAGLPVADQASGEAVVLAFQQAFIGALVVITAILLLILRNLRDTLLVLLPLLLAGAMTGATTVLLDSPFNFANIIALPLLMGLGVDNGIHLVNRLRHAASTDENPLHTSTATGVFFSSLTTLCSFSSLAFTAHVGTASMGLLLAVGTTYTLFCTLVILPAFSGRKL